jgi:23S rRNA (guanosine2251-2'-O)-methyltransferase
MKKLSMDDLNRISVDEFRATAKKYFVFVLDDVRSMNNVGSIFRTADSFCAEKIYLCGITGTPPHREISKTALGADESVAWEHAADGLELIKRLQDEGFIVAALEQVEGSMSLLDFMPETNKKYAFVLGNEVFGVNQAIIEGCDVCLEIPQFGTKHSLNVSVSAGIVAWDFVSKNLTLK